MSIRKFKKKEKLHTSNFSDEYSNEFERKCFYDATGNNFSSRKLGKTKPYIGIYIHIMYTYTHKHTFLRNGHICFYVIYTKHYYYCSTEFISGAERRSGCVRCGLNGWLRSLATFMFVLSVGVEWFCVSQGCDLHCMDELASELPLPTPTLYTQTFLETFIYT